MATPFPSLRKKKQRGQFRKKKTERGLATSILTGEMATPPSWSKEKETGRLTYEEKDGESAGHLHSDYSSLRGWGDDRLHFTYSSLGDAEMATSCLVEGQERS